MEYTKLAYPILPANTILWVHVNSLSCLRHKKAGLFSPASVLLLRLSLRYQVTLIMIMQRALHLKRHRKTTDDISGLTAREREVLELICFAGELLDCRRPLHDVQRAGDKDCRPVINPFEPVS